VSERNPLFWGLWGQPEQIMKLEQIDGLEQVPALLNLLLKHRILQI